ncbi:MAG: hypothetical protein ABSH34_20335 [Verrucomicrobiota bacterium]|jgi:hypothetical protein
MKGTGRKLPEAVAALAVRGDAILCSLCEYGPSGELLPATGPMAKANPLRFGNLPSQSMS